MWNNSRSAESKQPSFDTLSTDFAERCLEAERSLLAAGWVDEVGLHDAVFVAGLKYGHFLDAGHAFAFGYLCQSADGGLETSVLECAAIAKGAGIALTVQDIDEILWLTEADPHDLEHYARSIRRLARKRLRARAAIRVIGEVFSNGAIEVFSRERSAKDLQFRVVA